MKTLVIYDSTGTIFFQASGDVKTPVGIPYLQVEIPQDKHLVYIDTTGEEHEPVYENIPKSDTELLQEQVNALNIALAEMMGV